MMGILAILMHPHHHHTRTHSLTHALSEAVTHRGQHGAKSIEGRRRSLLAVRSAGHTRGPELRPPENKSESESELQLSCE
jgi:hypothetical protein